MGHDADPDRVGAGRGRGADAERERIPDVSRCGGLEIVMRVERR